MRIPQSAPMKSLSGEWQRVRELPASSSPFLALEISLNSGRSNHSQGVPIFTCKVLVETIPLGRRESQHGGNAALHLLRDPILHDKDIQSVRMGIVQGKANPIEGTSPHPPAGEGPDWGCQSQVQG